MAYDLIDAPIFIYQTQTHALALLSLLLLTIQNNVLILIKIVIFGSSIVSFEQVTCSIIGTC